MLRSAMDWLGKRFQKRSTMSDLLEARRFLSGGSSVTSIPVTEKTALKFSAVFASVRIISETKASLPIHVYEKSSSGKDKRVRDHPVSHLLAFEPDEDYTPMTWNMVRQTHLCLWGNTYTEIEFAGRTPEIARMIPRAPWLVEPYRGLDGRLYYRVQDENGGGVRILDRSQMLHVPGFSLDGVVGVSVVRNFMDDAIRIGLAADRFVASFFQNSGRPSIVVEYPEKLTDEGAARLVDGIDQQMQRLHKPLVLEHGAKMQALTMPLADAQLLESRKFQGEEIATRFFRLPPHVAGYLDHAKFNNIESQDRYFEKYSMRPWLELDEQWMEKTLFSGAERGRFRVKINSDAILRGSLKERYDSYRLGLIAGFITINEARAFEDMEPLPGGDELPRPAAIWGKDEPGTDPVNPGGEDDSEEPDARIDPRLEAITVQTLRGLINREAVQLGRLATKSPQEFLQGVESFYSRHAGIVAEKLGPVSPSRDQFLRMLSDHKREVLDLASNLRDVPRAVQRCVEDWQRDAGHVARQLLLNNYHEYKLPEEGTDDED